MLQVLSSIPTGKYLASGGSGYDEDSTAVQLWDIKTRKMLTALAGHKRGITSIAFDPAGKYLASGREDNTVQVWDVKAEKILTLLKHTEEIREVTFDPTGKYLASAGGGFYKDNSIQLWDVKTGKALTTLARHTQRVNCIAFDYTGEYLASGSEGKTVRLWAVKTGKLLTTLTGHTSKIRSVVFDPTGKYFVSGSEDNTIRVWEIRTGNAIAILVGHTDGVTSVAFNSLGEYLASGSEDRSILIWQCTSTDKTQWQVVHRFIAFWTLNAPNAQLEGTIISSQNKQLLKQRGAKGESLTVSETLKFNKDQLTGRLKSFVTNIKVSPTLTKKTTAPSTTTEVTTTTTTTMTTTTMTTNVSNFLYRSPISQPAPSKYQVTRKPSVLSPAPVLSKHAKEEEQGTKPSQNKVLPGSTTEDTKKKNDTLEQEKCTIM